MLAIDATPSGVYAGGTFTEADGLSAERVAYWNGAAWQALGAGVHAGENEEANSVLFAPSQELASPL